MKPTMQLRWRSAGTDEREIRVKAQWGFNSADEFVLEQLWRDDAGHEEWRAIPEAGHTQVCPDCGQQWNSDGTVAVMAPNWCVACLERMKALHSGDNYDKPAQ